MSDNKGVTLSELLNKLDGLSEKIEMVGGGLEKKALLSEEVLVIQFRAIDPDKTFRINGVTFTVDRKAVLVIEEVTE